MVDQIQADYEALTQIQKQFQEMEETTKTMRGRILVAYEDIKDGTGWKGEAATAFTREMDNVVVTWLNNLTTAMNQSAQSMGVIADKFRKAEEAVKASSPDGAAGG